MKIFDAVQRVSRLPKLIITLVRLPTVRLVFYSRIAPEKIRAAYTAFNKPHARMPLIGNKTLGIAVIDLSNFNSSADYVATVKKKDFAGHHGRQARKRGYSVRRINRNAHIAEIYRINRSAESRQGRAMDAQYQQLQTRYDEAEPLQSFGVFNADDILVGYCSLGIYGNFAATDRLLGIKSTDGVMYLLFVEIICVLIDQTQLQYFMYDTYLGAQPGLRSFKRRIGFQPYRARYTMI